MEILQTESYKKWFRKLKDVRARNRISNAFKRYQIEGAILGDVKFLGDHVYELRFHFGPGYRVYYLRQKKMIVLLLLGGDKSGQAADIATAKQMAKEIKGGVVAEAIYCWDASEYLETDEDIIVYLDEALKTSDPKLFQAALGDVAKSYGMTELARKTGLGRESLYKALTTVGNPSFQTITKVVEALGGKVSIVSSKDVA